MQNLRSVSTQDTFSEEATTTGRGFKALQIRLGVTYLTGDIAQGRGETMEISPVSAVILADTPPPAQDQPITVYFDNLGRFEGHVTAVEAGKLTVSFANRRSKIFRLADALTWAVNANELGAEKRLYTRHAENSVTTVALPDGSHCACTVTDISVSGASLVISPRPSIGTVLKIGKVSGRVIRHHKQGVGMIFARPSDIDVTRRAIMTC